MRTEHGYHPCLVRKETVLVRTLVYEQGAQGSNSMLAYQPGVHPKAGHPIAPCLSFLYVQNKDDTFQCHEMGLDLLSLCAHVIFKWKELEKWDVFPFYFLVAQDV